MRARTILRAALLVARSVVGQSCVATGTRTTITPAPNSPATTLITNGEDAVVTYHAGTNPAAYAASCGTVSIFAGGAAGLSDGGIVYASGDSASTAYVEFAGQQGTLSYCEYCRLAFFSTFSSISIQSFLQGGIITQFNGALTSASYAFTADYISAATITMFNAASVSIGTMTGGAAAFFVPSPVYPSVTASVVDGAYLFVYSPTADVTIATVTNAAQVLVALPSGTYHSAIFPNVNGPTGGGLGPALTVAGYQSGFFSASGSGYSAIAQGITAVLLGTSVTGDFINGPGSISGPDCTASVFARADVTIGSGVTLQFLTRGTVTLLAGAGPATLYDGLAAVALGVTVTASPTVTLTASAGTSFSTLGSGSTTYTRVFTQQNPTNYMSETVTSSYTATYTVYEAVLSGSGNGQRRRRLPIATAQACASHQTWCYIGGVKGYACVDTMSDIFNCGGCSRTGAGVDCTEQTNEMVQCKQGQCEIEHFEL